MVDSRDRASNRILDCFRGLMEIINQICISTAESEARGYRALLTYVLKRFSVFASWQTKFLAL